MWRDAHWRLFAVRDPAPVASGSASRVELDPEGFVLRDARPGTTLVRVRHTRWWAVTGGAACVAPGRAGMTRVRTLRAGTVPSARRLTGEHCRR